MSFTQGVKLSDEANDMNISFTADESQTFYSVIDSELRCVINEWDNDTNRRPNQKRIADGKHAHSIMDKWSKTQNLIPGTSFINLSNIVACTLDLTPEEVKYSKHLLDKTVKELRKELTGINMPYTGMYQTFDETATNAENILARL